jgi:hypothetical protein
MKTQADVGIGPVSCENCSVFKKGEGGPEAPGALRLRNKKATASVASSYSQNPPVQFCNRFKGAQKNKYRTPTEKAPLQPVQRNLPTYLPRNPSNNLYSSQFDGFPEISDGKYKASQRNTVETGNNDGLWGNFDGFGNKSPVESVQKDTPRESRTEIYEIYLPTSLIVSGTFIRG